MKLIKVSMVYFAMDSTKNQILLEAESLYKRLGLKSVSMDDVARKLGMSKKTLYLHFARKEDLIREVMELGYQQDMAHFIANHEQATDAIDEFLGNSRHFIREMRSISPTLFYDMQKYYRNIWLEQTQAHVGYFAASIKENLTRGIEEGLYRGNLLPDVITKIYISTILALMDTSQFPAIDTSMDRIIQQQSLYHLYGVLTETGHTRLAEHLEREKLE